MGILNKVFTRMVDFILALLGILLISPILIVIAIIIKLTSKGPILFKQVRIGKNSIEFKILKFRTMIVNAEKLGKQITVGSDNRITGIGKILRKYKLDELPQLINVIKGDMSLVGPRPEVPYYVNMYNEEQKKVLNVKPGITDIASLRYKNENDLLGSVENAEEYYVKTVMPDKLKLNLEYIEKKNIFFDISIIMKTIIKCL